jgi:hypothetical protein
MPRPNPRPLPVTRARRPESPAVTRRIAHSPPADTVKEHRESAARRAERARHRAAPCRAAQLVACAGHDAPPDVRATSFTRTMALGPWRRSLTRVLNAGSDASTSYRCVEALAARWSAEQRRAVPRRAFLRGAHAVPHGAARARASHAAPEPGSPAERRCSTRVMHRDSDRKLETVTPSGCATACAAGGRRANPNL